MSEKKPLNLMLIIIRFTYWIGVLLDFLSALATTIYMLALGDTFINDIFGYTPLTDITYSILIGKLASSFS